MCHFAGLKTGCYELAEPMRKIKKKPASGCTGAGASLQMQQP